MTALHEVSEKSPSKQALQALIISQFSLTHTSHPLRFSPRRDGQRAAAPPPEKTAHEEASERCTRTDTLHTVLYLMAKSWPSALGGMMGTAGLGMMGNAMAGYARSLQPNPVMASGFM